MRAVVQRRFGAPEVLETDELPDPPPVVDRVFPLDEAAAAHRHLESGGCFGKVILEQSAPTEGPPTEGRGR